MEAELHEVVEHLEHAGHVPHATLRRTVTLLILLVTVLTALTGLLAARANRHQAEAQRDRALHTVEAQNLAQASYGAYGQLLDDQAAAEDGYRRASVDRELAAEVGGSAAQQLRTEAVQWDAKNRAFYDRYSKIDLTSANAAVYTPQEQAQSDGRAADAWLSKEDANIGVAGLFAVCLFLLGLALTVPGTAVKWGFVSIGILLAVVGIVRGATINLSSVHRVPATALTAYEEGQKALLDGKQVEAISAFQKAVHADDSYIDGWLGLGNAQSLDQSDRGLLQSSAASYRKAMDLGEDGYLVHNNLGYVSLLLGDNKTAQEQIDDAATLSPETPFIAMSETEVALARGDSAAVTHWRDKTIELLGKFDSAFRDSFFSQLRASDKPALAAAGVAPAALDPFFADLRDTEASLDALHSAEPTDLAGATLSDLKAKYQKDRSRFEITFSQNGIHTGDVTSIRVYNTADESYSAYSSSPRVDVATAPGDYTFTAHAPIDQGSWRIEIYLNGHFQQSTTVQSPGDA